MLFKNISCALFLLISCASAPLLNAAPKVKQTGQYRASSVQVFDFFSKYGLDFQARCKELKNNQIDLDVLKKIVNETFEKAAQQIVFNNDGTVWDLLVKCFGNCAPENKLIKQFSAQCINAANVKRKKEAQINSSPYQKWQLDSRWPACTKEESAALALSVVTDSLCSFLEMNNLSEDMPEFCLVINILKAGRDAYLQVNCITQSRDASYALSMNSNNMTGTDDQDGTPLNWYDADQELTDTDTDAAYVYDFAHGDDLWNVVGQDMGWKSYMLIVATGVVAVISGYVSYYSYN